MLTLLEGHTEAHTRASGRGWTARVYNQPQGRARLPHSRSRPHCDHEATDLRHVATLSGCPLLPCPNTHHLPGSLSASERGSPERRLIFRHPRSVKQSQPQAGRKCACLIWNVPQTSLYLEKKLKRPWPGSSVGESVVLIHRGCGLDPWSGHI